MSRMKQTEGFILRRGFRVRAPRKMKTVDQRGVVLRLGDEIGGLRGVLTDLEDALEEISDGSEPAALLQARASGAAASAASAAWKRLATASLPMNDAWTLATAPWTWSKEGNSAPAMDALTATEDLTRAARPEEPARRSEQTAGGARQPRAPTGVSALERAMPPRLATQAAMIRVTLGLFTSGTRRMGDAFGARRRTESVSGRSNRRCFG